MKTCIICQEDFEPTSNNQKVCTKCKLAKKVADAEMEASPVMTVTPPPVEPVPEIKVPLKLCKGCNEGFEPTASNSKFCPKCSKKAPTFCAAVEVNPGILVGPDLIDKLIKAGYKAPVKIMTPPPDPVPEIKAPYVKPPWVEPSDLAGKLELYHRLKSELKIELTALLDGL
jgi:hypothetical protein